MHEEEPEETVKEIAAELGLDYNADLLVMPFTQGDTVSLDPYISAD